MRKHFLLLFLMALLPLAGWAESYTEVTVTLGTFSKTYDGTAATAPTVTVSGKKGSADVATLAVNTDYVLEWKYANAVIQPNAIINAGTYTVTVKAKNNGDTFTAATGETLSKTFSVSKAGTINVVAKNPSMVYGGTEPTITDFYEITNPGVFVSGESVANLGDPVSLPTIDKVNAGSRNFTLVAREFTNYDVSVSEPNGTLTIAQKAITITAKNLTAITYGAAKPTATLVDYADQLVGEDELEGTVAYDFIKVKTPSNLGINPGIVVTDAILPAGTYAVTPKGLSHNNYSITFAPGTLVVNQKTLTASMVKDIETVTYNGKNQAPTVTLEDKQGETNLIKSGDCTYTWTFKKKATDTPTNITDPSAANAFKNAGIYTVTLGAAADGNYKFTGTAPTKTYTINKKTLYVKTNDKEKDYDGTAYTFSSDNSHLTFVGLETGDEVAYSGFTIAAAPVAGKRTAIDAGDYTITVTRTDALTGAAADNYVAEYGNIGTLTINQRKITITPNPISVNYSGIESPYAEGVLAIGQATSATDLTEGKFQLTGTLAANETFTTMPTLTKAPGVANDVYALTPSAAVITYKAGTDDALVVTDNYDIDYKKSTFTIAAAGFTIWAQDKTSVFGEDLKPLTVKVQGIPDEDAAKIVYEEGYITVNAQKGSNRGVYTITIDKSKIKFDAIASTYDVENVTVVPGNYTITPKALKIKAKDQAHLVGETVTAADLKNIEFVTEGVSDADKAGVVGHITLAFSADAPAVPVTGGTALGDDAATSGYSGTTAAATAGVWVNGIKINVTAGDYWNTANYTLTGEGAETKAGTLYVTTAHTPVTFNILATATTQISNVAGKIVDATISLNEAGKKRTLYANEWNSLVLPFDITPFAFCDAIDGYAVFDVMQTTGEAMNFKITINEIPAYTPFLVKVSETVVLSEKKFEGVVIKAIADAAVANDAYIFQGNLAMSTPVPAWLFTADSEHSSKVEFGSIDLYHNVENAPTTAPNRPCPAFGAYIKAKPGVQAAPSIFIEEADGSTTAITAINADGVAVKAEGWYTINGVKLQGMPTEKGIYINNGKKIVIK